MGTIIMGIFAAIGAMAVGSYIKGFVGAAYGDWKSGR